MTLILCEVYQGEKANRRYLVNRGLRIYPLYWMCLLLAVIVLYFVKDAAHVNIGGDAPGSKGLRYPSGLWDWVKNVTFFGPEGSRYTVTQAWSLRVEMIFYVLMIFLCRRFWIVILWVIGSIAILVYHETSGSPFSLRYSSAQGASLAFALGSLVYYLRQRFTLNLLLRWTIAAVFLLNFVFAYKIWGFSQTNVTFYGFLKKDDYGLYPYMVLSALMLWVVLDSEPWIDGHKWLKSVGHYLGKIAYAIFLCHWIAAYIVIYFGIPYTDRPAFIVVSFLVVHLMSVALHYFVERPIDLKVRNKIRGSSGKS